MDMYEVESIEHWKYKLHTFYSYNYSQQYRPLTIEERKKIFISEWWKDGLSTAERRDIMNKIREKYNLQSIYYWCRDKWTDEDNRIKEGRYMLCMSSTTFFFEKFYENSNCGNMKVIKIWPTLFL